MSLFRSPRQLIEGAALLALTVLGLAQPAMAGDGWAGGVLYATMGSGTTGGTFDCNGVPGGPARLDRCGVCDADPANDCVQDCAGAWGGTAKLDPCGTCDADPANDCTQDCAGVWGGTATDCPQFNTTQVSFNDFYDKYPKLNNLGDIVWQGRPASAENDYEIFYRLGGAVTATQLTDNAFEDQYPYMNDMAEITWQGFDGTDWEIFLFSNGETSQLTANNTSDLFPRLNNSAQVVWQGHDGQDSEIYLYSGGATTRITDNDFNDVAPRINSNADLLWFGSPNGSGEVFTGRQGAAAVQVTSDDLHDHNGSVNDAGDLVWEVNDGHDCEIVVKPKTSATPIQITTNDAEDWYPVMNASGQVAWMGHDGVDWEIFLYADGSVIQVTDNATDDLYPQINTAGDLAWLTFNQTQIEISFYEASTGKIAKINATSAHYNSIPVMNDQGKIVWNGWDGTDFEIVMASPVGSLHDDIVFHPQRLNLRSRGQGFTASIDLPGGAAVENIDPASITITMVNGNLLANPVKATGRYRIADFDGNGTTELMVKFNRQEVIAAVKPYAPGIVELNVAGDYLGTRYDRFGTNTIQVVDKPVSQVRKAARTMVKLKDHLKRKRLAGKGK